MSRSRTARAAGRGPRSVERTATDLPRVAPGRDGPATPETRRAPVGSRASHAPPRLVVLASAVRSLINFRGHLLRDFIERGYEVVACAPDRDATTEAQLLALGVRFEPIRLARTGLNPLRDLRDLAALTALLRRLRPEVVLAYTIKPVIYGSLAARWAGVPAVHSMITGLGYAFGRGGLARRAVRGLAHGLYRRSLARNRVVFFQNPDDLGHFLSLRLVREEQAVLINGSGVDTEAFAPAPFPPGPPSFLLIARLIAEKGILDYVEAAREIRRSHPRATFRLVGAFDSNPTAIRPEQVAAWQREGLIEYLGRLDDVRPAIEDASVYVLPSYYREGTPRTVLEAMAMGRPVITTDAPGCRETVVDGDNGFLVPTRDPRALARAMAHFLDDPDRVERMGRRSRSFAETRYDVHEVNAAILEAMRRADPAAAGPRSVGRT